MNDFLFVELFKKTAANLHDFPKPPTSFLKKMKFNWKTRHDISGDAPRHVSTLYEIYTL